MTRTIDRYDRIINCNGSSKYVPKDGCNTWIDFWEAKSGSKRPRRCCIYGCLTKQTVGAHVRIVGETTKQYIVPMCPSHNSGSYKDVKQRPKKTIAVEVVPSSNWWCQIL